MDNIKDTIKKLLGKIFLTKPVMFGLDEHRIVILVSPSMKIFGITTKPNKLKNNFPFNELTYLNDTELIKWAEDNGYGITFSTNSPSLARKLYSSFGNVLVESVDNKKDKELNVIVLEELEKSHLPESVKNWAKDNPEKFIKNIKYIQELLKK
jgi:hypothetical protein